MSKVIKGKVVRYGITWPDDIEELEIELAMIRRGGKGPKNPQALPLVDHHMNVRKLCWPKRYRHRWTDLLHTEFIRNDITIMMGAASTQKTSHGSEFALINYFARPDNTLVIVSTINMEKLETGVFGEIKMLYKAAKDRFDWLPGTVLEAKKSIVTDNVSEGDIRDSRKGIVGRPCYIGGKWVGMGTLAGIKQDYIIYLCDELQFMAETFIGAWPNLFSNSESDDGFVKILGSGNPKHDPYDQLGIAAEPKNGWTSISIPDRTTVWDTKFMGGRCVNLVGTDSPNFDVPEGEPQPYPKLIGRKFAKRIANDYGAESPQFYSQVKGVMRIEFAHDRVITRQLCREHGALDAPKWLDDRRTKIFALDPSYGGEDRCVGMVLEFGDGIDGKVILSIVSVLICKLSLEINISIEDQIAGWTHGTMAAHEIPDQNGFYDSVGKGTLGFAFARKFGMVQPNPVDSGMQATERPVREGLLVVDQTTKMQRPKTCREHYSKFVSEMWFSVRYCIEAGQLRNLPDEVMVEGCARVYNYVAGNKIEVEPKHDPTVKEDLRRRLGKSPDLFDTLAVGVEGARQRGFAIASLGPVNDAYSDADDEWRNAEAREYEEAIQKNLLDWKV